MGHAVVNSILHRLKLYFTPSCLHCNLEQIENLEHLILLCPKYDFIRRQCFYYVNKYSTNNINNISNTINMIPKS